MTNEHKHTTEHETLLGVDFGETNTGLAFGKAGLVSPIKVMPSKDIHAAIHEIGRFTIHNKVDKLVVGLPLAYDGKETPQARKVRHFIKLLKVRIKKPIVLYNEYGSTKESLKETIDYGLSQRGRRSIDHYSAAVILKKCFETEKEHRKD